MVIAKDDKLENSFYVTVKSNVNNGLLDPFKCNDYKRHLFTVNKMENDQYNVKYLVNNICVTI